MEVRNIAKVIVVATAWCATFSPARGTELDDGTEIAISVQGHGIIPEHLIWEAEAGTANILQQIGLKVAWKVKNRSRTTVCRPVIDLSVAANAPDSLPHGVLASAHLPTSSITVFYDRIEPTIQRWPGLASVLLSHVFAHEIAHVLQSVHRHSDTGILKALWTRSDYFMMLNQQLAFTRLDTDLIRAGIVGICRNSGSSD